MTKILALVGSARAWGNSEILAREALLGAAEAGADNLHLLRLTDLHVRPCTGCMVCAIRGEPCPLDDDLPFLFQCVEEADGLVVAAPTYWLGPAASVKLILDRTLVPASDAAWAQTASRPAVVLTVSGLQEWRGVAIPFHNALALSVGCRLIGWMACQATGPGEVLLQPQTLDRARALGRSLVSGRSEFAPSGTVCPTCGADFFRFEGTQAICPVCGQAGTLTVAADSVTIDFDPPNAENRWSRTGLHHHVQEWVIPSGQRFLAHRHEIKAGRSRYDTLGATWIRPPKEAES